jgi:hypothetical protein
LKLQLAPKRKAHVIVRAWGWLASSPDEAHHDDDNGPFRPDPSAVIMAACTREGMRHAGSIASGGRSGPIESCRKTATSTSFRLAGPVRIGRRTGCTCGGDDRFFVWLVIKPAFLSVPDFGAIGGFTLWASGLGRNQTHPALTRAPVGAVVRNFV